MIDRQPLHADQGATTWPHQTQLRKGSEGCKCCQRGRRQLQRHLQLPQVRQSGQVGAQICLRSLRSRHHTIGHEWQAVDLQLSLAGSINS